MKRFLILLLPFFPAQTTAAWTGPEFELGPLRKILVSDFINQRVLEFAPDGTLLGDFGDSLTHVQLVTEPEQIIRDTEGRIYVLCRNGQVQRYDRDGTFLGNFASVDFGPSGITFDSTGNLYVVDNYMLSKFNLNGKLLWEKYKDLNYTYQYEGIPAVGPDGLLYVPLVDYFTARATGTLRITLEGEPVDFFGLSQDFKFAFSGANGIAFDSGGNAYITSSSDVGNHRFKPDGTFDGLFAPQISSNLVVDRDGSLWGTTSRGNSVVKYDDELNFVGTLIQSGESGVPEDFRPSGITFIYAIPEPSSCTLLLACSIVQIFVWWRTGSAPMSNADALFGLYSTD